MKKITLTYKVMCTIIIYRKYYRNGDSLDGKKFCTDIEYRFWYY